MSSSTILSGQQELTIPYGHGHVWLLVDWGLEGDSLDWKLIEAKAFEENGGLMVHYTLEKIKSGVFLVPELLRRFHDHEIREALWEALAPLLPPSKPEPHYVA